MKYGYPLFGFNQSYLITISKGQTTPKECLLLKWFLETYEPNRTFTPNIDLFLSDYPISRINAQQVSKMIKKLEKIGVLINTEKINTPEFISRKLKNKKLKGFGIGEKSCDWCKINTTTLHHHHYPILKSQGGKDTVSICANCHHEYHSLLNSKKYILNELIIKRLKDV